MRKLTWLTLLALLPLGLLFGCGELGTVDQGRVIDYDKAKQTVTMIQDSSRVHSKAEYNKLPPVTYTLPKVPSEMGPVPKAGLRMKLDTKAREIVVFDPETQKFRKITYTLIDQKENVEKYDPLVKDKTFPVIDKAKKTITVYSGRQKILTTFTLPEEEFARPDMTWDAGDEVRIYYHEAGKAQRFMNVSKTDIFKR